MNENMTQNLNNIQVFVLKYQQFNKFSPLGIFFHITFFK